MQTFNIARKPLLSSCGRSGGRIVVLLMAGLLCCALVAQDTPTFSSDVKVVNVLATVRDKHGQIVNSLSKDDFKLAQDGQPQSIRYFAKETDLPLTPRAAGGHQHEPAARARPGAHRQLQLPQQPDARRQGQGLCHSLRLGHRTFARPDLLAPETGGGAG